jgi:thioredoxin:protein disulfide reductase
MSVFVFCVFSCHPAVAPKAVPPSEKIVLGESADQKAQPPKQDESVRWQTDEAAARREAQTTGKPMVVYFTASWCTACKELEKETWTDSRVQASLTRFVALSVDVTNDEEPTGVLLKTNYHVVGLPAVVIVDSSGKEIARMNEFRAPSGMVKLLACASTVATQNSKSRCE